MEPLEVRLRSRALRAWRACPIEVPTSMGCELVSLPAGGRGPASSRSVALEVVLNKGPLVAYGLLGGEFHPRDHGDAAIEVSYIAEGEDSFESGLAPSSEVVRAGLPQEFVEAVVRGIRHAFVVDDCPPGLLEVKCAAHGLYGSNEVIFEYLGKQLAQLLTSSENDLEDRLADVLLAAP